MTIHHDRHHTGYVKKLNAALGKLAAAREAGDYGAIQALSGALAFNGSGHVPHSNYWESMNPDGRGEPQGDPRKAIERDFGSVGAFVAQFAAATKTVAGSGRGVLAYESLGGNLLVLQAEKDENLTIRGRTPCSFATCGSMPNTSSTRAAGPSTWTTP